MTFQLYEDQERAREMVREAYRQKHRRIMLQLPTGAGKTVVAASMTDAAREKQKKVMFTVPFVELVEQTVERFYENGIRDVGVIQGTGHHLEDWSKPVQVASIQTLQKRWPKLPEYDVAFVDEAHRWFKFYEEWLEAEDDRPIIGLSATPWTRGLGRWYTKLIRPVSMGQLITAGRLCPFRVYAPSHPELDGVKTVAGDYHEGQLSEAMRKPDLIGDVVQTWLERAENRPTLAFAVDSAHARVLTEQFLAAGVPAARVYSSMDGKSQTANERREVRRAFELGRIKVVVNVGVLTHGVDWDVRCLVIARPTKSQILHVQVVGRALRIAPGKDYALILDHSDNHLRLGFVTDIHHEKLNDGSPPKKGKGKDEVISPPLPRECAKCGALKNARVAKCPACGHETMALCTVRTGEGKLIEMREDRLEEIRENMRRVRRQERLDEVEYPRMTFAQLRWIARERGYKKGWAANKYREKYGDWPPRAWESDPQFEPSKALMNWITSEAIRWAHSRTRHVEA